MSQSKIAYVGYVRTSSLANRDGDSKPRQKRSIAKFVRDARGTLVKVFEEVLTGTEAVESRPVFAEMLLYMSKHSITHIVFEDAGRFARDLIVSEIAYRWLQGLGITLISAANPEQFLDDSPTARMIRQVLGCVMEFQKSAIVKQLAHAREEKSKTTSERTLRGTPKVVGKKVVWKAGPAERSAPYRKSGPKQKT